MNRTELVRDLLRSPYIKMLSESRSYSRSMIHRAIVSEVLRIEGEENQKTEQLNGKYVPDELSDNQEMSNAIQNLINISDEYGNVDDLRTVTIFVTKLFLKAKKTATPEDDDLAMQFYNKLEDMLSGDKIRDEGGGSHGDYFNQSYFDEKFVPWFKQTYEAYSKKIGQYYAQDASSFPELMKKDGKDFIKGLITFAQAQLGEEVYGKYQKTLINLLKKAIDAEAAKGEETIKEADGAEESQEDPSEAFANALQKLKVIDAEQAIMLAKKLKTLSDGPKKEVSGFDEVLKIEDTKEFFKGLVKFFKEKGLNNPDIVDALTLFSEKVQEIPDEAKPATVELDDETPGEGPDSPNPEEDEKQDQEAKPATVELDDEKDEELKVQSEAILREQPETVAAIKTIVKGLRDGGVDLDVDQNTLLRKKLLAIANRKPKAPVAEFSREDVEAILQLNTGNEILNAIEKKVKDSLGGRMSPELRKLALSIKDKTPGAIRDFLSSEIFAMDVGDQSDIEDKLSKIYPPEKDYSDHPLFKGLDKNERKIMAFVNEEVFEAREGQITKGDKVIGTFTGEDMKKRYLNSLGAVRYLEKEILPAIVMTLGQEAVGSMMQEGELEEGFFDSSKNKNQTTSLVSLVQRVMGRDNSDYIRNYTNFKKAFSSKEFRQFFGKLKGLVNAFMNPNMKVTVIGEDGEKEVLDPEKIQDGPKPEDGNGEDGGQNPEGGNDRKPTITQGEQNPNAEGGQNAEDGEDGEGENEQPTSAELDELPKAKPSLKERAIKLLKDRTGRDMSDMDIFEYQSFVALMIYFLKQRSSKDPKNEEVDKSKLGSGKQLDIIFSDAKLRSEFIKIDEFFDGELRTYVNRKYPFLEKTGSLSNIQLPSRRGKEKVLNPEDPENYDALDDEDFESGEGDDTGSNGDEDLPDNTNVDDEEDFGGDPDSGDDTFHLGRANMIAQQFIKYAKNSDSYNDTQLKPLFGTIKNIADNFMKKHSNYKKHLVIASLLRYVHYYHMDETGTNLEERKNRKQNKQQKAKEKNARSTGELKRKLDKMFKYETELGLEDAKLYHDILKKVFTMKGQLGNLFSKLKSSKGRVKALTNQYKPKKKGLADLPNNAEQIKQLSLEESLKPIIERMLREYRF